MQKLLQVFKPHLFKVLITALLLVIPLYPKFPSIRLPGIYVAVRIEDFLILFTLLIFLIPLISNIKQILANKIARSIILFLFIGLISTISGILVTQTTAPSIAFLHLFRRIEYLSLFFVGYLYIKTEKENNIFNYFIKVLLIVNFIVLMYGLGQRYLNFPVIITQNQEYSKGVALRWVDGAHINSTFAGHYDLASYLVLTTPFLISAFYIFKDKLSRFVLGCSVLSSFWLFSVAVSRISIVSFMVATAVSLFLLKKYKEIAIVFFISVLAFGFSADLRARYGRIIEVVKEKITSVVTVYAQTSEKEVFEDRSTSIRLNVEWPRALRALQKNPILGTGYSSITLATDNDYLRALGETGILGLLSFVLIFINLFKVVFKYKFTNNLESAMVAGFIGSTVGLLITALFLDIFEASKIAITYWLLAGVVIGTALKYSKNNNEQLN